MNVIIATIKEGRKTAMILAEVSMQMIVLYMTIREAEA